ncbi:MAG: hypothetical protein JWO69_1556 [Thermoleophilia bacterium]|jgi:flagellar assembly protein FliH|nr:hypothetical protein [Thermoleophilia bacterium]
MAGVFPSFQNFDGFENGEGALPQRFDTVELPRHATATSMRDPQQPGFFPDDSPLVSPGLPRGARTMVERPVLEDIAVARQVRATLSAVVQPVVVDPAEEARRMIADARNTARSMLAQAREVISAERAQAVTDGHAEGYAAGLANADDETAGLVQTCEKIGVHVMQERERVLAENEDSIVELAIAIAQRIVNASVDVDETLVVEACRGAMRKAFQRGSMQVLAHPDDLAILRDAGPQLAQELGGVDHLDFIEERRIDRGSVIVRTPAGEIDGTIRGKSDKIEQALREGIEQRRADRRAA